MEAESVRRPGVAAGSVAQRTSGGRDIAARLGVFLFLGGAVVTALGPIWPHPDEIDTTGFFALAALQLAAAAAIYLMPKEWTRYRWVPAAIVIVGIVAVSGGVFFNGERAGGPPIMNEFFYVWPAFYIGYFFNWRGMVSLLALMAATYTAVLIAIDPRDAEFGVLFARWVVTVTVFTFSALAMHQLRRAIDRLRLRLEGAARTDSLTMLLNRRGFDERFALEIERSKRTGDPFALLVGDLDHFKELNDREGHPAGDEALAVVGQTLSMASRAVDTVARIGGEEFGLLLPSTGAVGAVEAAERLRGDVGRACEIHTLTISFGVAQYPRDGDTPLELVDAADRALYEAKRQGGDRTVVCSEETARASS
jgi:diguanylate cyclase (GGDEF)-like protein